MNSGLPRTTSKTSKWPRQVRFGRKSVSIYRRRTPSGNHAFMVANYASGKRRLDSYPSEAEALEAARQLARQLSERNVLAAELTNEDAAALAAVKQALAPHHVNLPLAAETLSECLREVGTLENLRAAVRVFATRHSVNLPQRTVREAVEDCLAAKAKTGKSARYLADLRHRLGRFAGAFQCQLASLTAEAIQAWLDGLKVGPQSQLNYRRVLKLLVAFAKRQRYLPKDWDELDRLESLKVPSGKIEIFTAAEIGRLLAAAAPDFVPVMAIGAFAGLRSAEIERLDWREVKLAEGHIEVSASKAKTGSRRIVPVSPNLALWLDPCRQSNGLVWPHQRNYLYLSQQRTAAKANVPWKHNALRHSFISYRLAEVQNAAQVSLEAGNSPQMIFKHYRELVTAAQARQWFEVVPYVGGKPSE